MFCLACFKHLATLAEATWTTNMEECTYEFREKIKQANLEEYNNPLDVLKLQLV